jgi:small subunit ribosomal protein S13
MPRIAGVDVPNDKPIGIALTYIFGVGHTTSGRILKEANIDVRMRAKDLSEEEVGRIAGIIDGNCTVEGQLRRQLAAARQRLIDIGCYRGIRHRRGLPVRGQSTRQNARTRKGPRKTVAGKKGIKEMR